MSNKKNKQDILGDLLGKTEFDNIHGLEELSKLVRRCTQSTLDDLKTENVKPKKQATRKTYRKKGKKSVSHIVSNKILKQLTRTKGEVKELLPQGIRKEVTKSSIVEHALFIVLNEFDKKGKESALVKQLLMGKQ